MAASRSHWGIEHQLHWVPDVAFREDDCRVRPGNAAENFAVIRHVALNLIRAAKNADPKFDKASVRAKRIVAAVNEQYMLRLLGIHS